MRDNLRDSERFQKLVKDLGNQLSIPFVSGHFALYYTVQINAKKTSKENVKWA